MTALLSLAAVALLVLAFVLWQQRRRSAALQRQLDLAAAELQQLQQACARLAPAGVVDRMVADGLHGAAEMPAERKVVTALFSDLVGFTAMSEKLAPPVLARILDGYFQRVSDAVHAHSGHVSTWLGDGMLAYFGALRPNPWQCADAVRCRAGDDRGDPQLQRGAGPRRSAAAGLRHRHPPRPGLAGMIGSRERREYGFVGRTVNLAARVQSLTRTHGVEILVTEAVRAELGDVFELNAMPPERVKGIDEPVATSAVVGVARLDPAAGAVSIDSSTSHDPAHPCPDRDRRRRHCWLLHRLSPDDDGPAGRAAARAGQAHLRHHLARRRPGRTDAAQSQHDANEPVRHRAVLDARGRNGAGHRMEAVRQRQRGAHARADESVAQAARTRTRIRRRGATGHAGGGGRAFTRSCAPTTCRGRSGSQATARPTRPTSRCRSPRARAIVARHRRGLRGQVGVEVERGAVRGVRVRTPRASSWFAARCWSIARASGRDSSARWPA